MFNWKIQECQIMSNDCFHSISSAGIQMASEGLSDEQILKQILILMNF